MMNEKDSQRVAILVINDDGKPDAARSLDIKVHQVEPRSSEHGINAINGFHADVVVVDSGFHPWSGLSVLRKIRNDHPEVPVIFMTKVNSADAKDAAEELGAHECHNKTLDVVKLQELIKQILSERRNTVQNALPPEDPGEFETMSPHIKSASLVRKQNIQNIVFYIKNNLWSPLELDGLAEKAHLSKFHFCRIFKKHIGMNPMKYVAILRIERAKELLKKESLTVSSVANEVGFKDLSNFIRQFKKVTGMTPSMFRDESRIVNTPETMTAMQQHV